MYAVGYAQTPQEAGTCPEARPERSGRVATRTTTELYLTVPWLEIHDLPITESFSPEAEDRVVHLPGTGFPWQPGANVCLGDGDGTPGHHVPHDLPSIREGDEVILEGSGGKEYVHRVGETLIGCRFVARADRAR